MSTLLSIIDVSLESGFMYAMMVMGFCVTYSIMDFPDMTVEGTVLTGGVVFALMVNAGISPYIAIIAAFICGAIAGTVTGVLHVKLNIRPLLCGILVSTALITVNLIVTVVGMGGSFNGEGALTNIAIGRSVPVLYRVFPFNLIPEGVLNLNLRKLVAFAVVTIVVKILLDLYLKTKNGMIIYATGNNERFRAMLARNPGTSKIIGLAIGNGLAAVTGALISQSRGNANQSMGIGMVVIGIASVIIGTSIFKNAKKMKLTTKVIIGAIIYQACLAIASFLGVPTAYNKLIMAVLFTIALVISGKLELKGGKKA